jgi:phospho-N-acetylmuramoyl-pentapeptide-transferase
MTEGKPLLLLILAALCCAALLKLLLASGLAARLALDQPNARSLHVTPTPRCGGLGVVAVALMSAALGLPQSALFMTGFALLAVISWLDDRGGMPIVVRFASHFIAAILIVIGVPDTFWLRSVLAVFAMVWGTNLFNFMDGANGMSSAMLLAGFASYALAGWQVGSWPVEVSAALAGAGIGFGWFNRTPARLFLGDVGSIPAGFAMGAIGFLGWHQALWPWWFPWLVFSPFVADASFTLCRRAWRREKVWRAHREHFYQRLIQSGFSHSSTASLWFCMMLTAGCLALSLRQASGVVVAVAIGSYLLALAGIALWIERRYARVAHEPA